MEQAETKSTYIGGLETTTQTEPSIRERESASPSAFGARHADSAPASAEKTGTQDLARELDKLLDRLPGLAGEERDKAKAEFLELAAKSTTSATELVAKSADVAKRVTGRVRNEWETGRQRAETFVHANPIRAAAIALGVGVVFGARLFGNSRRPRSPL